MKNKKGVLGLDMIKLVMISLLVLAVITVSIIIALSSIRDVADDIDRDTVTITNLTTATKVNYTGAYPTGVDENTRNCILSVTNAYNETHISEIITATNYTITGCKIALTSKDIAYNNSAWNLTGSYTFSNERVSYISGNVSDATSGFFENSSTILAILIVVVIILAISIIIGVVTRFGSGSGEISGGGRSYGSDTVMGI